jgi:hypothetical protein
MAPDRPFRVALSYSRALSFALLFAALPGEAAEPLDCGKFFTPARSSSFSFAWREDRCEGFVEQKMAYHHSSIKISYLAFGSLNSKDPRRIENAGDAEIEVRGELKSTHALYRVVARLAPRQSIEWRYPTPLEQSYGVRPDRISWLASRPGAKENVYRPFTVSGSRELTLGIVSTDFTFNAAEVRLYDAKDKELCSKTPKFSNVVPVNDQRTFVIDSCGTDLAAVRRISVVAVLRHSDRPPRYSGTDAIWIE